MDGASSDQPYSETDITTAANESAAVFAEAIARAPFALLLTNMHGEIRRVTCPVSQGSAEVKEALRGKHIASLFQNKDREFLGSLTSKLRSTTAFALENMQFKLIGSNRDPVYLSVELVSEASIDEQLLAWHISRERTHSSSSNMTDARARKRINVLQSRLDIQRRRADQATVSLNALRKSNRILSHSLATARELRQQQTTTLRQMIESRDESVERSRELHAAATESRIVANEARHRLRLLAEASWALTETLDVNETLQRLCNLLVPELTDCCAVHLTTQDGQVIHPATSACSDDDVQQRVAAYGDCRVEDLAVTHPIRYALLTGHPAVAHDLARAELVNTGDACTLIDCAEDCGITSCMVAPLRSRDRTFGTLTLASTRPGHVYRPIDLQFVEDLALRAAQALDNSMLFEEVVDATESRERYLSIASHELRSPLAVVSGFGSLLLRHIESPEIDKERIRNIGNEMQQGIERLEILTSNLLVSATLEAQTGSLQRRRADLVRIVIEVIDQVLVTLPPKQRDRINLTSDAAIFGQWNVEGVQRAIVNVVSNALKYSDPSSKVDIVLERHGDTAVTTIKDQGIGMSVEELDDLFVPFARGRNASQTAPGTGLGMYITQQIIQQHGGHVDVQSQPGKGSTVTLTLPVEHGSNGHLALVKP